MAHNSKIKVIQLFDYFWEFKIQKCEVYVLKNEKKSLVYKGSIKSFLFETNLQFYEIVSLETVGTLFKKYIMIVEEPKKGMIKYRDLYRVFDEYTSSSSFTTLPKHVFLEKLKRDMHVFRNVLEESVFFEYARFLEEPIPNAVERLTLKQLTSRIAYKHYVEAIEDLCKVLKSSEKEKKEGTLSLSEVYLYKNVADFFINTLNNEKSNEYDIICGAAVGDIVGSPFEFDQGDKKKTLNYYHQIPIIPMIR